LFVTIPAVGPVIFLGYIAATAISAIEGAVVVGGLSTLGAALFSVGVPKDSVIQYEADLKTDDFLVMAHGTTEEMLRAKAVLGAGSPSRLELHTAAPAVKSVGGLVPAGG
jgi:hypothetical protein